MRRDIILKPSSNLCNKLYQCFSKFQYFVYKINGLSPWTLKVSEMFKKNSRIEDDLKQIFKISYIGSSYNILLMLGIVFYGIYLENALRQLDEVDETQLDLPEEIPAENFESSVTELLMFITWLIETISVSWIQLFYVYKQKSMIKVINRLSCVDRKLNISVDSYAKKNINRISTSMVRISLVEESVLQEIDNLENLYIELCEIRDDINNFYGLLLLMSIVSLSHHLIDVISVLILQSSIPSEILELIFYLAPVIFVPWVIFLTLVLTFAVSKTIDQSQETGPLINLLSEQCPTNPQVNERIVNFSRDLLFFKVEFSAWGTFPVDRNLLRIVCGTVTTFVVIFVA
ncbi:hypothetical protein KQX54_020596 [Cotesia glomerata]|uniref:Gustatory receptor n=1 Tax=Cotesia glomerata TaxID=32391 RepID=A0AAV7IEA0_COTGL|nr:hypothetical protein KQX54_020596 [Cotesia glomerata]